ncbi:unnamed protein product [Rhizophagus irregularis]|nr:unnamed protein product [Rhizophagus irregularis]
MWELASGVPIFYDIPDICEGKRLEIKEGTMPEEYEELMKRCWDNDPEKRPTAKKIKVDLKIMKKDYLYLNMNRKLHVIQKLIMM